MKPSDLRALLEKASPRPWRFDDLSGCIMAASNRARNEIDEDAQVIVALVNLAPLLIELWGAAIKLAEDEDCWVGFYEALGKLEKS